MTQATMARPHAPRRAFPPISVIVLFVVGALLCVAMAFALEDPDVVRRVTVENHGPIPVNVDVRGSTSGSRLILDTVPSGSAAANLDVLDQGDTWIFGFSSGGVDGGSMRVSRAQLAADVVARLQSSRYVSPAETPR